MMQEISGARRLNIMLNIILNVSTTEYTGEKGFIRISGKIQHADHTFTTYPVSVFITIEPRYFESVTAE